MKTIKCKVCECEFIPEVKNHYVSRDNGRYGLLNIGGGDEEQLYDTFDCPQCGCQNVVGERKRVQCIGKNKLEENEESEE